MLYKRSLYCIYLVAFIDLFAVSLFLPLLSKEIKDLGGDPILIGLIGSVYGGVQLFSSPVVGWGSDKYGSKFVLFFCLLFTSLAYLLQGYASSLILLLVARAIAGCFKHTQTISKSIATSLSPQEKSHVLGNFNAFGSMGFICGPTIGSHLVELEGGFFSVCLLASVSFLVNILILVLFVNTKKKAKSTSFQKKIDNNLHDLDNNETTNILCLPIPSSIFQETNNDPFSPPKYSVVAILILKFLYSSSTIIPRANLPLIFDTKFSTSVVQIGYLNSLQALVSTLTGFAVGPVVAKIYRNNNERMVKTAGIVKTLSLLALVFAPTFRLAGISMLLQSAVDPFLRVGLTSLSLEGHEDPGTILGLGQTATSLSRMLAPAVAGIAQSISEDGPSFAGTLAALSGLLGSYLVGRKRLQKERRHSHSKSNGSLSKQPLLFESTIIDKKSVLQENYHNL